MIRAAFIGTGNISRAHLTYLASRADVEIAALCDVDEQAAAARRKSYGGTVYTDFERMLDTERPDAVWVCTPPTVRYAPLAACAKGGVPVFCEKPAAFTREDAARTAAMIESTGARVQIGYPFRAIPVVKTLRELLVSDQVHAFSSIYSCGASLTHGLRPWFYDKDRSGGALVDQATHCLDTLRLLLGEAESVGGHASNPVRGKAAGYTIDEVIALSFRLASGAVGTHTHTWAGDGWRAELTLFGERRYYRIDLMKGELTVQEGSETRIVRQGTAALHTYENDVFLSMVAAGTWERNPCTYSDAARTLALTLDCNEALEAGVAGRVAGGR